MKPEAVIAWACAAGVLLAVLADSALRFKPVQNAAAEYIEMHRGVGR